MLSSGRTHDLLHKPRRHTPALRGQMNILGRTVSSSPSGNLLLPPGTGGWGGRLDPACKTPSSAAFLSTRILEKTGSSCLTRTDSRVLSPSQGWAPHPIVHKEVPTRHLSPVTEKGGSPKLAGSLPWEGISSLSKQHGTRWFLSVNANEPP